jgi:hypothetical protein
MPAGLASDGDGGGVIRPNFARMRRKTRTRGDSGYSIGLDGIGQQIEERELLFVVEVADNQQSRDRGRVTSFTTAAKVLD